MMSGTAAKLTATDRIFVAGHRGLAGQAMCRALRLAGFENLITRTHDDLELRDRDATAAVFDRERPDAVILCAARVGGIKANATRPVDFLAENLEIQGNVIGCAHDYDVQRLVFLGSSCIYPRDCVQPMPEAALLSGPLEATNRPYAIAKIAGIELCWAYNRQFGRRYLALMPTNLFGPGDNYDLEGSHVLPALIRRMHEARQRGAPNITLWGTGAPLREFLYSDDLADAALHVMQLPERVLTTLFNDDHPPLLNVGFGAEITIRDLATRIAAIVGYSGEIRWDSSQPDGTPRKLLDSTRIRALDWAPRMSLDDGIRAAYADFQSAGTRL
ncbi:MAG: GDP-L-fucose synthase [Pseudomonadota bacterium]